MTMTRLTTMLRNERWPLLGLIGTWLAFFAPVLSGRYVYFLDDLKIIYYPLEIAYASFQSLGELPLWSNYFGFGHPLLAWGQLGFFTPLHLLLRAWEISPLNVLQFSVVLYYLAGLLGMYAWLRKESLSQASSFLGAVVFVFSGFHLGHLNHVNFYTGTMILPFLLLGISALVRRPSWGGILGISLAATTITLAAQPQIVLYVFVVATFVGLIRGIAFAWQHRPPPAWYGKILGGVLIAAVVSLTLSSYALLPLAEFLPLTERNDALPEAVLFEFSYPPSHAITFLLPYFFGDHDNYWGAKGFQELAGFVGIIPLALAGVALVSWRDKRWLRGVAITLLVGGALVALGENSFLYRWLVEEKILTALAIPGRFIFFSLFGVSLLAALGLNDVITRRQGKLRLVIASTWLPLLTLIPFLASLRNNSEPVARLRELAWNLDTSFLFLILGSGVLVWFIYQERNLSTLAALTVTALTFIVIGISYNPLLLRSEVAISPLLPRLVEASEEESPRIYSREALIGAPVQSEAIASDPISPSFQVYQPVEVVSARPACFRIPLEATPGQSGTIAVGFHRELTGPFLDQALIHSRDTLTQADQRICFNKIPADLKSGFISFTSGESSGLTLSLLKQEAVSAYLIRVQNPTPAQILSSQKNRRVVLTPDIPSGFHETPLLARHLQSTVGVSSARWIGALSIRPYREFIEFFFANDREPFDGDGNHVLDENKSIVNFAGITHLASLKPTEQLVDQTAAAGYELVTTEMAAGYEYNLYRNLEALPKAFTVDGALFLPADDEARLALKAAQFDPQSLVYIDGPTPPPAEALTGAADHSAATVDVVRYTQTEIEVAVEAPQPTWLVVTDSTSPQWQTYLDGEPANYYVANTIFKAAFVPAGEHTVFFYYESPAVAQATALTRLGLGLVVLLFGLAVWQNMSLTRSKA